MNFLIKTMVIVAVFALIVTVVTALALAFGAALAYWLPLSLFQATLLFCASAGLTILAALTVVAIQYTDDRSPGYDDDPWRNVHRNAPCPCGSGRKFKNCCGREP